MEIDFTRLNSIPYEGKERRINGEPSKTLSDEQTQKTDIDTAKANTSPTEPLKDTTGVLKLQRKANEEKKEREKALEVFEEHQRNTRKSEAMLEEILKGANGGEDIGSLLLKACQVISLLTANSVFYTQIERATRTQRERTQSERKPANELHSILANIAKLRAAQNRETDPRELDRIRREIEANEERAAEIQIKRYK